MGNRPSGRANGGTIHASLARHRSGRSAKSGRSTRRISLLQSTRVREPVEREPPETLPPNIEHPFELDLMDLKMQRNLCGCVHPLARVDVVVDAEDGRRAFIDRRIALHASASDIQIVHQELYIHCYLTRQSILANDDQRPHPHLVTLIGHNNFQQTLHILTEYYPYGSLLSRILPVEGTTGVKGPGQIHDESDVLWAARQLCNAVAFMHDEGVVHMDIALDNIFVDATGALRLGDFRHSIYVGTRQRHRHVAPTPVRRAYGAPELYTGREVDLLKADAWSVGIVIVMLLTKQMPLSEATTHDTHYRLLQVLGVPAFLERLIQDTVRHPESHHPSPAVQDLVKLLTDLLECEPNKRLSITAALERYPWLALSAPLPNESTGPASTPAVALVSMSGPEIESDSAAKASP